MHPETQNPHPAGVTAYQNTHAHFTANLHQQVREAMLSAGLQPPDVILFDGQLYRFSSSGKRNNKNGFYQLHGDPVPAGYFGCWKTGVYSKWRADIGRDLTDDEKRVHSRRVAEMQRQREAEEKARHQEAAIKAQKLWKAATPADEAHPYLSKKRIKPHSARFAKNGDLLVPMTDADGIIWNVEQISPDGKLKRGLTGGKRTGLFHQIGEILQDSVICVVEGFATGCSIHEATEHACVVAFNCGNLPAVAQAIRQKYTNNQIIICADDDHQTDGNPGVTKAREAAAAVGALVAVPIFGADRPEKATDFNDMAICCGAEAVQEIFLTLINSSGDIGDNGDKKVESLENNQLDNDNLSPTEKKQVGITGDKSHFMVVEWQKGKRNGVYFIDQSEEKTETWLCDPLHVLAQTRDAGQSNWGRLLEWTDADGHRHQWACPAELLQSTDQSEFRRILASGGLVISTNSKARKLLCDYVLGHRVDVKARCVDKIGWHGGRYVLPSSAIGDGGGDLLVYQGANLSDFSTSGSLEDWRTSVPEMAQGNSRIVFSISCAFAGVLVEMAGESGGGFQFTGETSKGKTSTMIDPAASVWGHPEQFAKKWRATVNGLEAICLARNHNIMILDDLGQIEPQDAGQAAYLIANGQARARMSRDTSARHTPTWKTLLLSSGEIDLSRHIESAGKKAKGGQIARLPSIPADTGSGWYAIEDLRGCIDGREFSGKIKALARKYHGTAGLQFLQELTNEFQTIEAEIKQQIEKVVSLLKLEPGHAPEVGRIAQRFALVAYAGELATRYGITGWRQGEAISATIKCFNAWRETSGGSIGHDEKALLNQVSAYLQAYGASRFPRHDIASDELAKIPLKAGYTRIEDERTQFLVESGAFRNELCKGFDQKFAVKVLSDRGWLIRGTDRAQQKPRIQALNKSIHVYVIDSIAIEGEQS